MGPSPGTSDGDDLLPTGDHEVARAEHLEGHQDRLGLVRATQGELEEPLAGRVRYRVEDRSLEKAA